MIPMVKYDLKDFTKEKNLKSKGVYMIEHIPTGIKYIGSTKVSFNMRWRSHINGLYKGIGNVTLLNIFNKYGPDGFNFKIIEDMPYSTEIEIRQKERFWIQYYDTYNNGANCTLETTSAFLDQNNIYKHKYSEEEKIIKMLQSPTKKKVYIYDENGKLLYVFPSSVSCDRFFGLKKGYTSYTINDSVRLSILHKYYPSYELINWIPKNVVKERFHAKAIKTANARKANGSYKMDDHQKQAIRLSNKLRKLVNLCDLDRNIIKTFNSLNECDDYLGMTRGSTSKVLKGKAKTLKRKYIPILI